MNLGTIIMEKIPNGLGILTTALIVTGLLGFALRMLQQKKKLTQLPYGKLILRLLKQYHKYLAGAALIIGPLHGYLVLGRLTLHTGYILMASIFVMFIIYLLGRFKILKSWLGWHRKMAFVVAALWLVHYIKPWLLIN